MKLSSAGQYPRDDFVTQETVHGRSLLDPGDGAQHLIPDSPALDANFRVAWRQRDRRPLNQRRVVRIVEGWAH